MAEEMKPVAYAYADGRWCETDEIHARFYGTPTPLYTAAQLESARAAAYAEALEDAAKVADRKEANWRKRPTKMSPDTAVHTVANDIRALPNKYGRG